MADKRYDLYCVTNPVFYDSPAAQNNGASRFDAAQRPLPAGWSQADIGWWRHVNPPLKRLPSQGWKIHVSACLGNASEVLDITWKFCLDRRLAFKFLPTRQLLLVQNSKYASRTSSGKFITIYPSGHAELLRTLTDLESALENQPGPYILSDLRWNDGPLYIRYGGFSERHCLDQVTGDLILAIEDPAGELVPDIRGAVFRLPEWVEVPDFIAAQIAQSALPRPDDFPYQIQRALHFSNGGGVYLAEDTRSGRAVVLKEARPHAGLDGRGRDAVTRLRCERAALQALGGLGIVPELLDYVTCWEHHFLVEEYIDGASLNSEYVERYPFIRAAPTPEDISEYSCWALSIIADLERLVAAVHERGYVIGDLHPGNILLRDDHVVLVDLEVATRADEGASRSLAAPGFVAPRSYSGVEADRYALGCMELALFLPLSILFELNPAVADTLLRDVAVMFPIPATIVARIRRNMGMGEARFMTSQESLRCPDDWVFRPRCSQEYDWDLIRKSVADGIVASATPEDEHRLFPGDIAQFTDDALSLAYGAAGVLYALARAGFETAESHEAWLLNKVKQTDTIRPGLYNGLHGVALALDYLGWHHEALTIMERVANAGTAMRDISLFSGLAGIGLNLLHFHDRTSDPHFLVEALRIADQLLAVLEDAPGESPDGAGAAAALSKAGLMYGCSGPALLAIRLYEHTRDDYLLEIAGRWIRRDLARCTVARDGSLQVDEGWRIMPYVESGSTGVGLVLGEYLSYAADQELGDRLTLIDRAAQIDFVVYPSLFLGRAGLMAYLAHRGSREPDGRWHGYVRQHLPRLAWHAVPCQGHVAFPGHELRRLSMDLATGSAGILLALTSALNMSAFPLPFVHAPADAEHGLVTAHGL